MDEHRELIGCDRLHFIWVSCGTTCYMLKCDKTDCTKYAICPYNTKMNMPSNNERRNKQ